MAQRPEPPAIVVRENTFDHVTSAWARNVNPRCNTIQLSSARRGSLDRGADKSEHFRALLGQMVLLAGIELATY
jgi:hypothetical protein